MTPSNREITTTSPRSARAVLAGLAFAASFMMIGSARAQSIEVKIDGLNARQLHHALSAAATRVCRAEDYSPLAPISEAGCIEDTLAAAEKKAAEIRLHTAGVATVKTIAAASPAGR